MLLPKRVKYRRVHRGRLTGKAMRGNKVTYGEFGLVAVEPAWITSNQIEAARIAMTRYTKRGGQVWIKIFPDTPVTEKPAETRMGSGKGSPEYWVAVVKPGRVMFEIAGVSEEVAREALRLASHKVTLASDQEGLSRKLLEAHTSAGLTPPNLKDVLKELGVSSKEAAPVLRLLCEQKKLVRVKDGLYYGNEAVEEILDKVRLWFSDHEDLDVGGLKEILGLSRKYLIALLEFMDREKITVRVGDARQYRGR